MPLLTRTATILLALLSVLALACASAAPSSDPDAQAALAVALSAIEARSGRARDPVSSGAPLVVVISSSTPPSLRRASEALRPTVNDFNLPDLDRFSLPPGYLQPESLEIQGDTAIFRGLRGPVPAQGTAESSSACGHRFTITLSRTPDRTWRVEGVSVALC